jgi:excisionase family DNA binding protein
MVQKQDNPAYYTVPEAARYLRISESLLRRLLREGSIESRRCGRLVRIPASAVTAAQGRE